MPLLKDEEIDLETGDTLNTNVYAQTLVEVLGQVPPDTPFTIGLFGEWGSGKSSIVRTFSKKISETDKCKVITYDAWKYANDSFRRMFLLQVRRDLEIVPTDNFKSFYASNSQDVKNTPKADRKFAAITILIFLAAIVWVNNLPVHWESFKMNITLVATLLALIVNFLGRAFVYYRTTEQSPVLFAPEQFEECFDEMVSSSLVTALGKEKSKYWVEQATRKYERIVFVIDNIDRCSKEMSLELITTVKNFLGHRENIFFLIPVDEVALKGNLKDGDNDGGQEVEKYLRKFFNVIIRVKPFPRFDLFDFAQRINLNNKFSFAPATVDIIAKEFATNPRRIIQMFNNLLVELQIFRRIKGADFVRDHESIICKMLVIREEWPIFYEKYAKRPSLINFDEEIEPKRPRELQTFLSLTRSVTENVGPEILESVFSANDRDSKMVGEVREAIANRDVTALLAWIGGDEDRFNFVFEKLIEKLNRGFNRQLFRTEAVSIFELICEIGNIKSFSNHQHTQLRIEIEMQLYQFFPHLTQKHTVTKFADKSAKLGFEYLENFLQETIIRNINDEKNEINVIKQYRSWMVKFLENNQSSQFFEVVYNAFSKDYVKVNYLAEYDFSTAMLRSILNRGIYNRIISGMKVLYNSDQEFNNIVFASKQVQFTEPELLLFITKVHELHRSTNEVVHQDMITIISSLNSILDSQMTEIRPSVEGGDDLIALFEKFATARSMAGTTHYVISEAGGAELKILADFLFNIHRLSGEEITIDKQVAQIIDKDPNLKEVISKKKSELPGHYNKDNYKIFN